MKFYLKMAFMPFIYLIFSAMLGVGATTISGENLEWLKYSLCALNTIFYAVIMGMAAFKDGQQAIKVREQNDTYRRVIARTGEDLPLNLQEEYTPWKGIIISLIACIPSVILVIVHFCLNIGVPYPGNNGVGGIAALLNMVIFSFFMIDNVVTTAEYAFILLIVPFICGVYGGMYNIGAMQMQKQYDKIAETKRELHGDED